jgi:hypothetical protein
MMNGYEILMSTRNMQHIIKMKGASRSGQYGFTDMNNLHTCSIGGVNLIMSIVAIMHGKFFKLPCYVICGARVQIPV